MIAPQIIEELFRKQTGGTQVLDVFVIERQLFDIVNYLIQPCGDGIPIAAGIGTVEGVKDDTLIHSLHEISLHHGQFVQIRE